MLGLHANKVFRTRPFIKQTGSPSSHKYRNLIANKAAIRRVRFASLSSQRASPHETHFSEPESVEAADVPDLAARGKESAAARAQMRWKPLLGLTVLCALTMFLASPAMAATSSFNPSNALKGVLSFVLHLDDHLAQIIAKHGRSTYAILFAIVFAETGLVVTPFLPGDSLLFAAGAFAALGHLSLAGLMATFITSAILGDAVNYQIGKAFGTRAKESNSRLVKKEYIEKTEAFYLKHGGKTVVLARFIPIVRTFAPFVAGVGVMPYNRFSLYNVGGAVLWSVLFVGAGFLLGNLPAVKHNFSIVVFAIVGISLLPVLFEVWAAKREGASRELPPPSGGQAVQ